MMFVNAQKVADLGPPLEDEGPTRAWPSGNERIAILRLGCLLNHGIVLSTMLNLPMDML